MVIPMTLADTYILYLDNVGRGDPTGFLLPVLFYADPVISGPGYLTARLFGWHWRMSGSYDGPQLITILIVNCILWGAVGALLGEILKRFKNHRTATHQYLQSQIKI
jgi:hypothetical protein